MAKLDDVLKDISDVLSFAKNDLLLLEKVSSPNYKWEPIIKVSSSHLVLPTLFCRLKAKQLLPHLPLDLVEHLNDITIQNRERNRAILNQMLHISDLFKSLGIEFVFLKGAAMLAGRFYDDIAERMIGDIDVLVNPVKINQAKDALLNQGYDQKLLNTTADSFDLKHLPRFIHNDEIAAIELHTRLFATYKKMKELQTHRILNNKLELNSFHIPNISTMLYHNILNWQINDRGFYFKTVSLRAYYDSVIIFRKKPSLLSEVYNQSVIINHYLLLLSRYFNVGLKHVVHPIIKFFLFGIVKHQITRKIWFRLIYICYFLPKFIWSRFLKILFDKRYRKALIVERYRINWYLLSK